MIEFPTGPMHMSEPLIAALRSSGPSPGLGVHLREMFSSASACKRMVSTDVFRDQMSRDLTSGTMTAGGALIGTGNAPLEPLMRRYSVLGELGLRVMGGFTGPFTLPATATLPSASWLPADGTTIAESQPSFGQVAFTPKFIAAYMQLSRQLILQSSADTVVATLAIESVARAVDAAIFNGSGVSGQPQGVLSCPGIHSQSGTSLALAGLLNMREQVLLAGAREDRLAWIGHPTVQELLGGREGITGSGLPLWSGRAILGLPAVATRSVPTGTLILGDWSRCVVALFDGAGSGVGVEVDPYSDFRSGISAVRLLFAVDVGLSTPSAFSAATSIT
jgi:HK97 family phage major capsid protein